MVKAVNADAAFKERHAIGAVNSINWARILAQTVYYFYAWGRLSGGDPGFRASFSVPTGNFGDVFAGYLARAMGLPMERLLIATNRNDILTRFVHSGEYADAGEVYHTLSPAMDIQMASNFERYLYFLYDRDPAAVRALLADLAATGGLRVDGERLARVQAELEAVAVSDPETLEQIRATFAESGYILCPHTAVGVRAARGRPEMVCLATAHPAKFVEAVREAIGEDPPPPPSLRGLMDKESRCEELDATAEAISTHIRETLAQAGEGP
jgi:threonine synthase